ncbi:MAG: alanine and proline-rich secreted protein Apa, partial [Mycobacterium sp.]
MPTDRNTQPAPATEPGAPELGRVDETADGFSYVVPAGWVESDASKLEYGSALLSKQIGEPPLPGRPPPVANDTRIVLGKLDQRLYASAEADTTKATARLGSDMGEFFMPYQGTRINQENTPLNGNGMTGSASYYEVKFTDPAKPVGQIWTGVIGLPPANAGAPQSQRWFVVWLGTANDPVDKGAATTLAESIRPLAPPPPAAAPPAPPGAPAPP